MRYLLALICPPLALLLCHRPWQAGVALALLVVGLATFWWGVGALILFGIIIWAMNAVSDQIAAREISRFVRTVKPIRTYRG